MISWMMLHFKATEMHPAATAQWTHRKQSILRPCRRSPIGESPKFASSLMTLKLYDAHIGNEHVSINQSVVREVPWGQCKPQTSGVSRKQYTSLH